MVIFGSLDLSRLGHDCARPTWSLQSIRLSGQVVRTTLRPVGIDIRIASRIAVAKRAKLVELCRGADGGFA